MKTLEEMLQQDAGIELLLKRAALETEGFAEIEHPNGQHITYQQSSDGYTQRTLYGEHSC